MEEKEKPALSHTVSLPSPATTTPNDGNLKKSTAVQEETTVSDEKTPSCLDSSAAVSGPPKAGAFRSKSVRQKSSSTGSNKVWSFGDMAKAVGCGVTAFGTNAVSASKAVGSGVYHGSVAVGTNVMEGTKVASRMTKDVTKAAGKGVVQAGEMVGNAAVCTGKVVTSASVSAVQDTTKWVIEQQSELEAAVLGDSSGFANIGIPHVVSEGEDIVKIAQLYNIPVKNIIMANKLNSRFLMQGREICIPKGNTADVSGTLLTHPMEELHVTCVKIEEAKMSGYPVSVTFDTEQIFISSSDKIWRIHLNEMTSIFVEKASELEENIPELLPATVLSPKQEYSVEDTMADKREKGCDEEAPQMVLTFHHSEETQEGKEQVTKLRVSSNVFFEILGFIDLWYPELLDPVSIPLLSDPLIVSECEKSDLRRSHILDKVSVQAMHLALPNTFQSTKWNMIYSSNLDGYSLQNFYRKVTATGSEQFLLIIEDIEGDIFGAFLTCCPGLTEEFAGTGESWLFSLDKTEGLTKKYEWSGKNEYFFQGKANCLIIGACDGKFGIYIDGNIHHGRIDQCATFRNWPEKIKDFGVKNFECFYFT